MSHQHSLKLIICSTSTIPEKSKPSPRSLGQCLRTLVSEIRYSISRSNLRPPEIILFAIIHGSAYVLLWIPIYRHFRLPLPVGSDLAGAILCGICCTSFMLVIGLTSSLEIHRTRWWHSDWRCLGSMLFVAAYMSSLFSCFRWADMPRPPRLIPVLAHTIPSLALAMLLLFVWHFSVAYALNARQRASSRGWALSASLIPVFFLQTLAMATPATAGVEMSLLDLFAWFAYLSAFGFLAGLHFQPPYNPKLHGIARLEAENSGQSV